MTRIKPAKGWAAINLSELWEYRDLLYFLTWRDVKVRYKQTAIGVAWVLLQPLALMGIFTLFFGRLAKIPSDGIPYPVFALAGVLPWQLFSRTITDSTDSLITDQRLITKVYFPRLFVPTASSLAALIDFGISMVLLFLFMFFMRTRLEATILWLPVFVMLMVITALGVGYWLAALNVEYRDVMYTVPFLNQVWMFITPVVYPSSLVPARWRLVYGLNPMVSVVEGFRWCLFGVGSGPSPMLFFSAAISLALFASGILWFRNRERTFVDSLG
ncbi:MAG: ABC transporter permease [Syntrophobacteraceae bacterium]|nr:ABC transporter permease [Syntrophobacteraceae bacterium]